MTHSSLKPSYPKDSDGDTTLLQSWGSKQIKEDELRLGQASDIGTAPTMRIYTRDYSKAKPEKDDADLISPALGNPLDI